MTPNYAKMYEAHTKKVEKLETKFLIKLRKHVKVYTKFIDTIEGLRLKLLKEKVESEGKLKEIENIIEQITTKGDK